VNRNFPDRLLDFKPPSRPILGQAKAALIGLIEINAKNPKNEVLCRLASIDEDRGQNPE
jgi:hypothetical protein